MIPLRIVSHSTELNDRLFGRNPDRPEFRNARCLSFLTLALSESTLVHIGLTADFHLMLSRAMKVTYGDDEVLSIREIPRDTSFTTGEQFHEVVSLEREPLVEREDIDATGDIHKLGGQSFYLQMCPTPGLEFVAQIAFPDHRDLLLHLDWPTAEYTFEFLRDVARQEYCAVWRMHA